MRSVIEYQIDRIINDNFFLNNIKLRAQFRFWNNPDYQCLGSLHEYYEI